MSLATVRKLSMARHSENQSRAIERAEWVFDETHPEVGLPGGAILSPSGHTIAYVFSYEDGWRERITALITAANRGKENT